MYARSSAVDNFLYGINVPHLVNQSITMRIASNSILIIGSLNSNSFTRMFNNTELYTLSETYKDYNSPYSKCLKFLVF